jgi:hypothetical protein
VDCSPSLTLIIWQSTATTFWDLLTIVVSATGCNQHRKETYGCLCSDGRKVPVISLRKRAFDSASAAGMVDGMKGQWLPYRWAWAPRGEGVFSKVVAETSTNLDQSRRLHSRGLATLRLTWSARLIGVSPLTPRSQEPVTMWSGSVWSFDNSRQHVSYITWFWKPKIIKSLTNPPKCWISRWGPGILWFACREQQYMTRTLFFSPACAVTSCSRGLFSNTELYGTVQSPFPLSLQQPERTVHLSQGEWTVRDRDTCPDCSTDYQRAHKLIKTPNETHTVRRPRKCYRGRHVLRSSFRSPSLPLSDRRDVPASYLRYDSIYSVQGCNGDEYTKRHATKRGVCKTGHANISSPRYI